MAVARIDLDVPNGGHAARLFGALLGGRPDPAEPPGRALQQPFGATIAWADGAPGRAVLRTVVLDLSDPAGAVAGVRAAGHVVEEGPAGAVVHAGSLGTDLLLRPAGRPTAPPDGPAGAAGCTAFDHVCLGVPSLAEGVHLLRDLLGGEVVFGGHNAALGTLSSQVTFGTGTRLELLQPIGPDAAIATFLARRGPGLHHLTWHVANVATAVRGATDLGFDVVDTDLTSRAHWRETYVRPASAMGLLVQLSWTDLHHDDPLDDTAVAAILAGKVASHDYAMRAVTR